MFYIFIISICKKLMVIIPCFSWFYLQLSMKKIFRLMHNETLMNIVFPGFAIDLFLMSHDHFYTPTLKHTTWLSCHLRTQSPFSWICFMTVWTSDVFWGVVLGGGNCFLWLIYCGWVFLPLMGVTSAIVDSYEASYKPYWMWLSFTSFKPF